MIQSILNSIKKNLNIPEEYTAFDSDILLHINSVFAELNQLGVGPIDGFFIDDESVVWDDYLQGDKNLNGVKTFMFAKVRLLFDPPTNSFGVAALEKVITEQTWRINVYREERDYGQPTS